MADWRKLLDGVYTWRVLDPQREMWLNGYYLLLRRGGLMVDPPRMELAEQQEMEDALYPDGILMTSRYQQRHARWFKIRYGVDCYTHPLEANEVEPGLVVDLAFKDGEYIYGEAQVLHLPGKAPGEVGLYLSRDGGILLLGSAVIGDPPGEISLHFPRSEIDDVKQLKASLAGLKGRPVEHVLVSEGVPILNAGQTRLNRLLTAVGG